jgi:hypothetical protein
MNRQPVEPPDAVGPALREEAIVILGHEERVLAMLAESAEGVLQRLSAFSASYGIMAHSLSPKLASMQADKQSF